MEVALAGAGSTPADSAAEVLAAFTPVDSRAVDFTPAGTAVASAEMRAGGFDAGGFHASGFDAGGGFGGERAGGYDAEGFGGVAQAASMPVDTEPKAFMPARTAAL